MAQGRQTPPGVAPLHNPARESRWDPTRSGLEAGSPRCVYQLGAAELPLTADGPAAAQRTASFVPIAEARAAPVQLESPPQRKAIPPCSDLLYQTLSGRHQAELQALCARKATLSTIQVATTRNITKE